MSSAGEISVASVWAGPLRKMKVKEGEPLFCLYRISYRLNARPWVPLLPTDRSKVQVDTQFFKGDPECVKAAKQPLPASVPGKPATATPTELDLGW